jgi:hypothetical protein
MKHKLHFLTVIVKKNRPESAGLIGMFSFKNTQLLMQKRKKELGQ